ncbi:MAG: transporter ATP-binding protein [Clostridia bacterium]|jgi:putative ABC transport system ATP-binding protein|nr:transporter ATP-binding protein [Clostridia bacterium]
MIIQIENLHKVYDTGKIQVAALKGINFGIDEKEYVAIMGASGSGKSTLMNILGCLDRLTEGRYLLGGQDVSTMEGDALAAVRNKKIGFVFQAFNLLPRLTALDNVVLPMMYAGMNSTDRLKAAKLALKKVGLEDRMDHKPNELSGGQKQRVAIARALVNNPDIILADEPTGNLDTKSSEEIMEIFEGLNNEGATIIMVTHEQDIAMHTKRSIVFRDGQIISDKVNENRILRGGI